MKLIKKYNDYINESLSKKVYHFTMLNKLLNILSEDMLQTTPVMVTSADASQNKDKLYFFQLPHQDIQN